MNNYLAKGFYMIEKESKQLIILPNDVKLRTDEIDQLETDFAMAKNTAIYSVENTIKNCIFRKYTFALPTNFYKDKHKEIYDLFVE